jgi:hypothetical protein
VVVFDLSPWVAFLPRVPATGAPVAIVVDEDGEASFLEARGEIIEEVFFDAAELVKTSATPLLSLDARCGSIRRGT